MNMEREKTPYEGLHRLWIAGQWREGTGPKYTNTNPYTGEALYEAREATEGDVAQAYEAAKAAQREWAAMPPAARSGVMRRVGDLIEERREEIAGWITRELGGTRVKAMLETHLVSSVFREAATLPYMVEGRILPEDIPGKESRSYRGPIGVVGLISPWNFPFQLTARTLAPALAVGNAVVVKPAKDSAVTGGTLFAALFDEAGVPDGLISVLPGSGDVVGEAMVRHPIPRLISFTGSTPVGRRIMKATSDSRIMKLLELELGGNSPIVVLDDADLDRAVEASVWGKFMHSGQICMIANRIIVEDGLYDAFVDGFVERTRALGVGDPQDPETFVGPVINEAQFDKVTELIERAKKDESITTRLSGAPEGLVIPPHVFADVPEDSFLLHTEIFGPVAPISRARDEEHALQMANDTDYGLSSAVFTQDLERGVRFARQIEAGMTHINDQPVNDSPFGPFGGEKNSGLGRFNGRWAIDAFTTDHWITVQHEPRAYPWTAQDLEQ
jgi:aldehyde dehydrogenase (NAD+)